MNHKTLLYEQNPGNGSTSYLTKALWITADHMTDNTVSVNDYNDDLAAIFNGFSHESMEEVPNGSDSSPTANNGSDVISEMNNNYGMISWQCHGMPDHFNTRTVGLNTSRISGVWSGDGGGDTNPGYLSYLSNTNFPSIVYSMCCLTGAFDDSVHVYDNDWGMSSNYKSMVEEFLVSSSNGGPGFIGHTRSISMESAFNIQESFYTYLFGSSNRIGLAWSGSIANASAIYKNKLANCLFADPTQRIWMTGSPSEFSPTITVTDNQVIVDSNDYNCSITCSSDDYSYWVTADYVSSYAFNTSTRPLNIVIYKNNYIPYITIIGGSGKALGGLTNVTIFDDITIDADSAFTIYDNTLIKMAQDTKIIVNGTLTIKNNVRFRKSETGSYWDCIEIGPSGVINIEGDVDIEGAFNGLVCNNSEGLKLGGNVITIRDCPTAENQVITYILEEDTATSVELDEASDKNVSYSVYISPNPANPTTTIYYTIPNQSDVRLVIYTISGQKAVTLVDCPMSAGSHTVEFDGYGLSSGVYLYSFRADNYRTSGKLLLVK